MLCIRQYHICLFRVCIDGHILMGLMMINCFLTIQHNICPRLNSLPQCISNACPYLHVCSLNLMCFSCQLDEPYGFSGDHLQNAAMLQCTSRYLQSISVTVSLLYSVEKKKLTTTATATATTAAGTCTLTRLVVSHLKLHLQPVC